MAWPKTFLKSKYIFLGTHKKKFQLAQTLETPQHLSRHFSQEGNLAILPQTGNVSWGAGVFPGSERAENFFESSQQYIFWFKKGFGSCHRTLYFTKSGEITFNLSRFWDTCWLIKLETWQWRSSWFMNLLQLRDSWWWGRWQKEAPWLIPIQTFHTFSITHITVLHDCWQIIFTLSLLQYSFSTFYV